MKQQILKGIKVYKLWHGGIGIGSMPDGKKILIKGWALPGSIVDLTVVKRRKDYIEAHILETKKYDESFSDGEIFCPHYYIAKGESVINEGTSKIWCWGCKWQMINYEKQLQIKQQLVEDSFKKITKENPIRFLPILSSPLQRGYRNKIEFSFWPYIQQTEEYRKLHKQGVEDEEIEKQGIIKYKLHDPWNCGFHKQGEFSKIIDVDRCGLISEEANALYWYLKKKCKESWLPIYDQKTHQGFFRHLVIREGVHTHQLMVNLSVSLDNLNAQTSELRNTLLQEFKSDPFLKEKLTTFVITNNAGLSDTVRNEKSEPSIFWWEGVIHEELHFWEETDETVVTFRISPFSFFQTNTFWAEKLFSTAFKMLGNFKGNILDLYCGTGSIGLSLLKLAQKEKKSDTQLVGIEIVEDAIIDARHNAKINGLEGQSFFVASPAEKALANFPELQEKINNLGVVVIDPPREGLHPNVIERIANLKKEYPFKLLYISCNPVTMARDIELFIEKGFICKEVQPVDLFPHTHHIEDIAVLE